MRHLRNRLHLPLGHRIVLMYQPVDYLAAVAPLAFLLGLAQADTG